MTKRDLAEHQRGLRKVAALMARTHAPCDHARATPALEVPALTCPDCGAVFQIRRTK